MHRGREQRLRSAAVRARALRTIRLIAARARPRLGSGSGAEWHGSRRSVHSPGGRGSHTRARVGASGRVLPHGVRGPHRRRSRCAMRHGCRGPGLAHASPCLPRAWGRRAGAGRRSGARRSGARNVRGDELFPFGPRCASAAAAAGGGVAERHQLQWPLTRDTRTPRPATGARHAQRLELRCQRHEVCGDGGGDEPQPRVKWTAAVDFLDGEELRESSENFGRLFMDSSGVGNELCCARCATARRSV